MLGKFKNKSQISIFIVIGVILILVGVFLVFNNQIDFFVSTETKVKGEIANAVNDCIQKEAVRGTFLLGFQGGRIDTDKFTKIDPVNFQNKYLDLGFKIPTWDSEIGGSIPTLSTMENELSNFIKNESRTCININLKSLEEVYNISVGKEFEVKANLNSNSVDIQTYMPIKFNKINSKNIYFSSDFSVKLENLRLKELFNLAEKIYIKESQTNFFEKLVLEQIYSANDYSSKDSMPSEGMDIKCGFVPWTIPKLKDNLANLNNNNLRFLQFSGTYSKENLLNLNFNEELGTMNFKQYYQSSETGYLQDIGITDNSFSNFDVEVSMPNSLSTTSSGYINKYPYREFSVNPSNGQIVKPISLKIGSDLKIPIPCIQIYHHLYSLDYDLLVKITDKDQKSNNYFLQFPIRVQIKDNNPKQKIVQNLNLNPPTATNEKFCSNESSKYPAYIFARDKTTQSAIDGVNFTYKCISLSCDVGSSSKRLINLGDGRSVRMKNSNSFLETKLPFCNGGEIIGKKKGYFNGKIKQLKVDSSIFRDEKPAMFEMEMTPLLDFYVDVSSFLIIKREDKKGMRVLNESDGQIYVSFKDKNTKFESQILWPNSGDYFNKLELLDDPSVSYSVNVFYIDSDSNIRGMLNLENWKPDLNLITSGSKVSFNIPGSASPITANNLEEFSKYMNFVSGSDLYKISFD